MDQINHVEIVSPNPKDIDRFLREVVPDPPKDGSWAGPPRAMSHRRRARQRPATPTVRLPWTASTTSGPRPGSAA